MSVAATVVPTYYPHSMFRRFSVAEYHKLTEIGFLSEDDDVELIEGHVVQKMARNPPHCNALQRLTARLFRSAPLGWQLRIQMAVTLNESEPEPDAVLARGNESAFAHRHPHSLDIGLVVEVSDTSLLIDRTDKGRVYARANLPIYWIINVVDRQIEVSTDPRPKDPIPSYANRIDYKPGDSVPFVQDGQTIALIAVDELLG